MDPRLVRLAEHTIGFMPPNEGLVLYRAALQAGPLGALLEIGSYCGKSAVYLGAGAKEAGTILFSVDHHRGSEEQQPGQEYFDQRVVDPTTGRVDTLLLFRRTIDAAGLEDTVVPIVGRSEIVARRWTTPVALVFIDGGHSEESVRSDFEGWAPHVVRGGLLVFHDIYPDPSKGGQAPYRVYSEALAGGDFEVALAEGSLRVLKRVGDPLRDFVPTRQGLAAE
jgi:MMP 1-O-methyltransferase